MQGSEKEGINPSESSNTIVDDYVQIDDSSIEVQSPEIEENPYAKESAKETVARVLKEDAANSEAGGEGAEKPTRKTVVNKNQQVSKEELAEGVDPELLPPERLDSKQRQIFQNLPVGLKRGLHKTIKDLERGQTQQLAQYRSHYERATNDVKHLTEAISPYLAKWGDIGMTATQVITGLASAHDKLNNPETSQAAYIQLGQQLGHIDAEGRFLGQEYTGQSNAPANIDIANNPYVKQLEAKIISLQSKIDPIYTNHEQQFEKTVSSITAEMQSVRDEINPASGQFRYPELQNEEYLKMLSPRISEIAASTPGISYADALRQANQQWKQDIFGASATNNQIRPTARPTFNNNTRAVEAAQTVRGRISPSLTTQSTNGTPPPEALKDAKATTAWVIQQALLNQGR